jgi:hypothetical protein
MSRVRSYSIDLISAGSGEGGTVRLSLRLIVRSYLVDACTGTSAGFSPLTMQSKQGLGTLRPKSQSGIQQFTRQLTLPFFVRRKADGHDAGDV